MRSLLADLPPELRAALEDAEGPPVVEQAPGAQLEAVFQACTPYVFRAGPLTVYTDPRWYSTVPTGGAGAPLLVLRRWPGDTALAFYVVAGPVGGEGSEPPPVRGGRFELAEQVEGSYAEWHGSLETEAGPRPATWVQIAVPEAPSHLGALLAPGDAGLGATGVEDLTLELAAVLARVAADPERWKKLQSPPPGEPLVPPLLAATPGDKSEEEEPWQVARTSTFTVGLPPGFRARRMDAGVPPPVEIPGGALWFRGRFTDMEDATVVVGDESRAGYVALVDPMPEGWLKGSRPPLGAPGADRAAAEPFPLIADRADAERATAERWTEPGFAGDWLVFRLRFETRGVEIGLPVLAGRRSPSLYWIPATWRAANRAPAPPPVDPAERFDIRYARLRRSEREHQPWTQGYLTVPGMRVEVPLGWAPSASLRSRDGYPIRFVDSSGVTRGVLTRLDADAAAQISAGSDGWSESDRAGRHRAGRVLRKENGARLFVAREGHGFLFEPRKISESDQRELWERLAESILLLRPSRSGDAGAR